MIASTTPGRIRLRSKQMKSKYLLMKIKQTILTWDGVIEVRLNQNAGSIIVNYDLNQVAELDMEQRVESVCLTILNKTSYASTIGRVSKYGMIASIVPTVAYAIVGKKKYHTYAGSAFLVFAGLHMTRYSTRLLK